MQDFTWNRVFLLCHTVSVRDLNTSFATATTSIAEHETSWDDVRAARRFTNSSTFTFGFTQDTKTGLLGGGPVFV